VVVRSGRYLQPLRVASPLTTEAMVQPRPLSFEPPANARADFPEAHAPASAGAAAPRLLPRRGGHRFRDKAGRRHRRHGEQRQPGRFPRASRSIRTSGPACADPPEPLGSYFSAGSGRSAPRPRSARGTPDRAKDRRRTPCGFARGRDLRCEAESCRRPRGPGARPRRRCGRCPGAICRWGWGRIVRASSEAPAPFTVVRQSGIFQAD